MHARILLSIVAILLVMPGAFAEFRAGIATEIITPDPLLPVSGGIGTPAPVKEARGDLTVRALAIADDDTTVVVASVECIGFPRVLGDMVREKVIARMSADGASRRGRRTAPKDLLDLRPENIIIGATHTHSAPDLYLFKDENGTLSGDMDYAMSVVDHLTSAIRHALDTMEPVGLRVATGQAAERIAYNYYAPELYDRRASVLQFVRPNGSNLATLVNYAIHPEILGPGSGFLSPDLCGPLYDRIQSQGGGACIFMNGAQGGMVTADCRGEDGKDVQTWEECIRIGNLLADESLRIVKDAPLQKDPDLYCSAEFVEYPVDNPLFIALLKTSPLDYQLSMRNTATAQMNLLNIGNAQVLTIPGEALPNIGFYLKRKMNGEHNLLFGLTNDGYGYIMTKEDFDSFKRYAYMTRTSLGERTADVLIENCLNLVKRAPSPITLEH